MLDCKTGPTGISLISQTYLKEQSWVFLTTLNRDNKNVIIFILARMTPYSLISQVIMTYVNLDPVQAHCD